MVIISVLNRKTRISKKRHKELPFEDCFKNYANSFSPSFQVLLNTLIYFNTKYFMLKSCDHHKKLSFSSVMKHWKKGQGGAVKQGSNAQEKKTILLRFYPQSLKGSRGEARSWRHQSPVSSFEKKKNNLGTTLV